MSKKAPIHSYPADNNQSLGSWKAVYKATLRNCSNEELFGKEGPWDDLFPDSWEEYTDKGGWKAGEVENEIRRRLGVPEKDNKH